MSSFEKKTEKMIKSLIKHVKENEEQFTPSAKKAAEEFEKDFDPDMIKTITNCLLSRAVNPKILTHDNLNDFEKSHPGLLSKLSK